MENIMLHKPVTVLLVFIFSIHMKKYVNCSNCAFTLHIHITTIMCKPCVGAKLVLRFQALITHALLDRSIPFLCRKSACTCTGLLCRERISFISRFGAIVSHFVRGDIFLTHPVVHRVTIHLVAFLSCITAIVNSENYTKYFSICII